MNEQTIYDEIPVNTIDNRVVRKCKFSQLEPIRFYQDFYFIFLKVVNIRDLCELLSPNFQFPQIRFSHPHGKHYLVAGIFSQKSN